MKQYIYGGAFNPPTLAHQQITQHIVDYARKSNSGVVLLPSGNRSDKTINTPLETRLEYLKAMIDDVEKGSTPIRIETTELYRPRQIQTYETAIELQLKSPKDRLVWVFGSDSFNSMPEWENGDWLIENLPMLIIERPGYEIDKNLYTNQEKIIIQKIASTSSTELREKITNGNDYKNIVGSNVHRLLSQSRVTF